MQYLYFGTSHHWTGPVQSGRSMSVIFLPSQLTCYSRRVVDTKSNIPGFLVCPILTFTLAPAAAPPPPEPPLFPQVVQFIIMVYLYRAFGRKAALTRRTAMDNSDHAHLEDAPEEDLDYNVQNDGYIDPGTWPSQNRVMSPGVPVKVVEPHVTTSTQLT